MSISALVMITSLVAIELPGPAAHGTQATWFSNANAASCNLTGSFGDRALNVVFNRSAARGGELIVHIVPRDPVSGPLLIETAVTNESVTVLPDNGMHVVSGPLAETLRELMIDELPWAITTTGRDGVRASYEVTLGGSMAPLAAFDACEQVLVQRH